MADSTAYVRWSQIPFDLRGGNPLAHDIMSCLMIA